MEQPLSLYRLLDEPVPADRMEDVDTDRLRLAHATWQSILLRLLRDPRQPAVLQYRLSQLCEHVEKQFQGTSVGLFWHTAGLVTEAIARDHLHLHRGQRLGTWMQLEKAFRRLRRNLASGAPVVPDRPVNCGLLHLIQHCHPVSPELAEAQTMANLEKWLNGEPDPDLQLPEPDEAMMDMVTRYLSNPADEPVSEPG